MFFPFPNQFTLREADEVQRWRLAYADSTIASGSQFNLPNRKKREIIDFMTRNERPGAKVA